MERGWGIEVGLACVVALEVGVAHLRILAGEKGLGQFCAIATQ